MTKASLDQARREQGMQAVRLSAGETAYQVHGASGPWVVLVHGLVTPSFAWIETAERLARAGFRVLRYDHFGRGCSDRPAIDYTPAVYDAQLGELTQHLGIAQMHLVGWSMGAVIASRLARQSPSRILSLALIAPGFFFRSPVRFLSMLPGGRALIRKKALAAVDRIDAMHLARPERVPEYAAKVRRQFEVDGADASLASTVIHYPRRGLAGLQSSTPAPFPVLVVWGDQDRVTPFADAGAVLQAFLGAKLVTVRGAGHGCHLDHAEEVQPALLEHLRRGLAPSVA